MTGPVVDLHSHFFPPAVLERLAARDEAPRITDDTIVSQAGTLPLGRQWFDLPYRLAQLDRAGIVHQLVSWPTTLNLEPVLDPAEAPSFWRAVNDGYGALVQAHPGRFSALAAVSTADAAWSVEELRRAHHELGLIGLVLPVNSFASREGARYLAPLLREGQRLGPHLYLHTGHASGRVPGQPAPEARPHLPGLAWTLDIMHQFAGAFATVALTDALDDYPDLSVQIAMLGGAGAAALLLEQATIGTGRAGAPPRHERLARLWLDTGAAGQGPAAIRLAADMLGPARIVFGSDHAPAQDVGAVLGNVRRAPLPADTLDAILFRNGRTLLARHGIPLPPATAHASAGDDHVRV